LDIGKALSFPFEDQDWVVKILIGGILSLIPIADFLVFGYVFNILKKSAQDGEYVLPAWDGWGRLFEQGFLVFLVGLIYFLIPFILIVIGGVFLVAIRHSYGVAPLIGLGILFLVLGGIIGFVIGLFVPMAMTLYAATGEFGQAFNFREIFSRIGGNAGNYALVIVINFGLAIVLGIIRQIPLVGFLIGIFAVFYVTVATSYLFGAVYRGDAAIAPPM